MAVVVARVGSEIVKVQCKTCKKERGYKAPKGISDPSDALKSKEAKATKKATAASSRAASKAIESSTIEAEWTRLMKEAKDIKPVKYSYKVTYSLGEVIEHPTFGPGVVVKTIHPDKIEVLFQSDLKLLIHSKG